MTNQDIRDSDVERLLRGLEPQDPELASLASGVAELRRLGESSLDPAVVTRLASQAAAVALDTKPPGDRVAPKPRTRSRRLRLAPGLAASAAAMILLMGTTGAALAANSSAPGDAFYGLDRAFERVGVANGGLEERLAEAEALVKKGETEAALTHASHALKESGDEASATALMETAERLRANVQGSGKAMSVRQGVADMLDWMATTEKSGREFGQGVADRARGIGGGNGAGPPDHAGNGEGPGGPPDNAPGKANGRSAN